MERIFSFKGYSNKKINDKQSEITIQAYSGKNRKN